MDVPLLTNPDELGLMYASDNKTKGHKHAAFLKKHDTVRIAKAMWVGVVKTHMQRFYIKNNSGQWSVKSINKNGVDTIAKWAPYSTDTKEAYLRAHEEATAAEAQI